MTEYRLPVEPVGPLWWWHPMGGEWIKFERGTAWSGQALWFRTGLKDRAQGEDWADLLQLPGGVTDVEPIVESEDELKDAMVSAASAWYLAQNTRTEKALRESAERLNKKRHQICDEQLRRIEWKENG